MKKSLPQGNVMTEYLVVMVFMVAVVWLAIMGVPDGDDETPTVISVLNDQQHEFARDVYQP